ncbi:PREDICTED: astacin-like metalloprotease toxin 5 isoform X1 [Cyprinodon variegatus]|uniref:astacin-like metalloprotease toxin 5 isoform X1 n=1 Tax=Cyprinodon variegatus TaxID=28743 RepID=UPI000742815B|nr:PREDICTED: astacin-like metalloprotease toxin 5 isoform X1 [Cyprinodon variegatus]
MTLGGTRSSSGTKAMLLQLLVVLLFVEQVKNVPLVDVKTLPKGNVQPETLEEIVSDRIELVEGDMLMSIGTDLSGIQNRNKRTDRNAVGDSWPTTALPYEISPEIKHRTDDVIAAMAMVSEHTCITFHRREPSEKNYVLFQISNGCAAHVGFMGGQQSVFVGPSCNVGNIAHEILHSLGFQHEHTRLDRDDYIEIVQSNIIPGMEKNFKKMSGKTFSVPYDYSSIMHYGR